MPLALHGIQIRQGTCYGTGVRRDRSIFRRALEISLLVHLLLIFLLLPGLRRVWPATTQVAELVAAAPETAEHPLKFELVDMPGQAEEPEPDAPAPLSDMDRRAHGGTGAAAARPAAAGTTPQLVQAQGARRLGRGAPPVQPGPRARQVPPPQPQPQVPPRRESPEEAQQRVRKRGVGEPQPEEAEPRPAIQLPPPGAWQLPPDIGGMAESPDTRGGRVDTGTLSFDTRWYDWGPYAAAMLRKIRRHWKIPEIAMLGVEGMVKIRFFIERDGTVTGLRIIQESGKPPMDFAARDAIADSSRFEPLPGDLTGIEREGVTISFYYNTRPPDWDE